jgi:AbrB family looped-hinge helix DNA binding protein
MVTTADNGRVYIPKEMREKFGERFHIVDLQDKIVLVPVSGDQAIRWRP